MSLGSLVSETHERGIVNGYLMLPETVVNVVDRLVPTAVTAPMMTTAMSAAISPYSMAVAPLSLEIKREIVLIELSPKTPNPAIIATRPKFLANKFVKSLAKSKF